MLLLLLLLLLLMPSRAELTLSLGCPTGWLLVTFFECTLASKEILLLIVWFIRRVYQRVSVHRHSIYGILASALLLATKYQDDERFANKHIASLLAIPLVYLNAMEVTLFTLLNYSLYPTDDDPCYVYALSTVTTKRTKS